jgi:hypothetical protein|tara:strand:- start:4321 stop:5544 length:1224 start_codon:yes stop_codon:yes gene_type:complete
MRTLFNVYAIAALVLISLSQIVLADPQSKSYSYWRFDDNKAQMIYSIGTREITRLPSYQTNADTGQVIAAHLAETIAIINNDQRCRPTTPKLQTAKAGFERLELSFECDTTIEQVDIFVGTMFQYADSHVHFARFKFDDKPSFEFLFTPRHTKQTLVLNADDDNVTSSSSAEVFFAYIYLGFEHILIGLDHIAFLLTLLLLASRLRDVLLVITGFTIGHSITLSLAVLELATPDLMVVEALIGFTIALVAIENIVTSTGAHNKAAWLSGGFFILLALLTATVISGPPVYTLIGLALFSLCYLKLSDSTQTALKLRPALTGLFGLIHGFGFANVLLEVGLPQNKILSALFGFNIGVEFGQIAIVLVIALLGLLLRKLIPSLKYHLGNQLLSAILCGLGMFWFIQRSYF